MKKIDPSLPYVAVVNGELLLYSEKGEMINGNVFVRVHEEIGSPTSAICKFHVNMVGSVEEMFKAIDAAKKGIQVR